MVYFVLVTQFLFFHYVLSTCPYGSDSAMNKCYMRVANTTKNGKVCGWQNAETLCQNLGGHLVSIPSAFTNYYISSYMIYSGADSSFYLGASCSANTNFTWVWSDGTTITYQNMQNNANLSTCQSQSCLRMDVASGKWSISICSSSTKVLCQFEDVEACNNCTCPPTWTYYGATNSCYKPTFFIPYNESRFNVCQADGGELTSIHSTIEGQFVANISSINILSSCNKYPSYVWIGLFDQFGNNSFTWLDGSPLDYTNWAQYQPMPVRECVALFGTSIDSNHTSGMFSTRWCADYPYYSAVCKKAAN